MLGLFDYAEQHPEAGQLPAQEQEAMTERAARVEDQRHDMERAAEIKAALIQRLSQGEPAQYILYSALECIGLLTADKEWMHEAQGIIDGLYDGLQQQSMLYDVEAKVQARVDRQVTDYARQMRSTAARKLSGCRQIEQGLLSILDALNRIDPPPQQGETSDQ